MISRLLAVLIIGLLTLNLASAIVVKSVNSPTLTPGKEGLITAEVENNFDRDVKDVVFQLDFTNLPFIPVGTSTKVEEKIRDGDEERFSFRLRASNDITPGDYQIPYTIEFKDDDNLMKSTGEIGISVTADSDVTYSLDTENPVIGQEGKITFKIVNKGFADTKFVLVNIFPDGFTLLSEGKVYVGTINSDDFDTATFNVIFTEKFPTLVATVEYRDFENKKITDSVTLPVKVFTKEKAIELGIIKKNNTILYIEIVAGLIVLLFIYRTIKKRHRLKRSRRG